MWCSLRFRLAWYSAQNVMQSININTRRERGRHQRYLSSFDPFDNLGFQVLEIRVVFTNGAACYRNAAGNH